MRFENILFATDFGEGAEQAAEVAVALAVRFDARITLFHVFGLPMVTYADGLSVPMDELESAAREALGAAAGRIRKRWPKVEPVLACGVAWQQIVGAIKERGADLVVLGTHGRRGLSRALLGSVAEKIVRLSPVPVVTVPIAPPDD